jgi:hypothetical protein
MRQPQPPPEFVVLVPALVSLVSVSLSAAMETSLASLGSPSG